MKKIILSVLLFCVSFLEAQNDTVHHGSIKIAKKKDTVYVTAFAKFDVFQKTEEKVGKSYGEFVHSVSGMQLAIKAVDPCPVVSGFTAPFDYTAYLNSKINAKDLVTSDILDTVEIRIDVRNNGKVYYKHLSKNSRINNKVMFYDKRKRAYGPSVIHSLSMQALKDLKEWNPAYEELPRRGRFKGTTVIKPVQEPLHASGVLTIVFSRIPIELSASR